MSETSPEQQPDQPSAPANAPESTIGTGTAIALGCVAATLVLVVIGLAFLAVAGLLR